MAAQFIFKRIALPNPKDLESSGLQRTVGPVSLVSNGITPALFCFVSYSVFEVEHVTGPSACLGFIVAGLLSIFYGLCYTDLSTHYPSCGSVYTYTYVAMGRIPAFVIGWNNFIDISFGVALMAKLTSNSIDVMLDGKLNAFLLKYVGRLAPAQPTNVTGAAWPPIFGETLDLPSVALLLLFTMLLFLRVSVSLTANAIVVGILLPMIAAILGASFVLGDTESFTRNFFKHGFYGFSRSVSFAVVCNMFYDLLATISEEAENPSRDIPIANLLVLVITTSFTSCSAAAFSFIRPFYMVSSFAEAFEELGRPTFLWITVLVTLITMLDSVYIGFYGASRYLFAIARDGLMPTPLAYIHPRCGTPMASITAVGVFSSFMALFFHRQFLEKTIQVGSLCSVFVIGIDLILIRYLPTEGEEELHNGMELRQLPQRYLSRWKCLEWLKQPVFFKVLLFFLTITILTSLSLLLDLAFRRRTFLIPLLTAVLLLGVVISFSVLCVYKPRDRVGEGFTVRGLPFVPVCAIMTSVSLITHIYSLAVVRFLVATCIGLVICISLSMYRHSISRKEDYDALEGNNTTDKRAFDRADDQRKTI